MIEPWKLSEKTLKECFKIAFPDNSGDIKIDQSKSVARIFSVTGEGLEEYDLSIRENGAISGSPTQTKDGHQQVMKHLGLSE